MKLTRAVQAWGTPEFQDVLKAEVEGVGVNELPLQQALCAGNYVLDEKPTVMINHVGQHGDLIVARVGVLFAGVDAGSCCANDPTSVEPHHEYCVLQLEIERATGETRVSLLDS